MSPPERKLKRPAQTSVMANGARLRERLGARCPTRAMFSPASIDGIILALHTKRAADGSLLTRALSSGIAYGNSRRLVIETSVRVPVSYTHLRAHETRHDLVCRLLL